MAIPVDWILMSDESVPLPVRADPIAELRRRIPLVPFNSDPTSYAIFADLPIPVNFVHWHSPTPRPTRPHPLRNLGGSATKIVLGEHDVDVLSPASCNWQPAMPRVERRRQIVAPTLSEPLTQFPPDEALAAITMSPLATRQHATMRPSFAFGTMVDAVLPPLRDSVFPVTPRRAIIERQSHAVAFPLPPADEITLLGDYLANLTRQPRHRTASIPAQATTSLYLGPITDDPIVIGMWRTDPTRAPRYPRIITTGHTAHPTDAVTVDLPTWPLFDSQVIPGRTRQPARPSGTSLAPLPPSPDEAILLGWHTDAPARTPPQRRAAQPLGHAAGGPWFPMLAVEYLVQWGADTAWPHAARTATPAVVSATLTNDVAALTPTPDAAQYVTWSEQQHARPRVATLTPAAYAIHVQAQLPWPPGGPYYTVAGQVFQAGAIAGAIVEADGRGGE